MRQLSYSSPIDYSIGESLLIAFLITLFITGVFAFPGFVFPTSNIMPERYWLPKDPDRLNFLFKILGVNTFKSILVILFWGRKTNRKKYYSGTRKGLQDFNYQTKQSEFGHLGALVIIAIASLFLLFKGYILITLLMTIINIIGNLYPILLQRHHRIRILQLANRLSL